MPNPIDIVQDVPQLGQLDYEARERRLAAGELQLNLLKRRSRQLQDEVHRVRQEKRVLEEDAVRRGEALEERKARQTMVEVLGKLANKNKK